MSSKKNNSKNTSSSSSKFVFWMIALVAVVLVGFIFLSKHTPQSNTQTDNKVAIDYSNEPYLGKSSAPVSIIEFGDYKCPNCKTFNESAIPAIIQEVVDNGQAKLYFLNDSFINVDSTRAAKFGEAVYAVLGNDAFWKFHELLYQNQPVGSKYEKMDVYTEKFLINILKQADPKADVNKVAAYFEANKADAAWKKDMNIAAKLNVTGTPTLFVNGKLFDGSTVNDIVKMVDSAAKEKGNE